MIFTLLCLREIAISYLLLNSMHRYIHIKHIPTVSYFHLKTYTDSPAFAHHKEWNEKNAGREVLPPSLIKETKASYGFDRPKSVCSDASTSNNSLVEKVFKKLKLEMKKLKGHDP